MAEQIARLELRIAGAHQTASGSVVAGLVLRLGQTTFPGGEDWTDFAVVVLSWWAEAVLRLQREDTASEAVNFMEGPHLVRLTRVAAGSWHVELVTGPYSQNPQVVAESNSPIGPLIQSVIHSSDDILRACKEGGWENDDSARLMALVDQLRDLE
jgi:hypothetical protein